jgi:hypothetical protein
MGAPGETDLHLLLAGLEPAARPCAYAVLDHAPEGITPAAVVEEDEGTTVVVEADLARTAGVVVDHEYAWITLRVHSSLLAVGLLAAVAARLAGAGIPCNPLTGFHHDHLLVPVERADEAVAVLRALQREHAG